MKFVPHDYQRYCINRLIAEPALGLFLVFKNKNLGPERWLSS